MVNVNRDIVAICPVDNPDTTASGRIYIPDQAIGRTNQGIVKYIGSNVKDIEIGDYVMYPQYSGTLVILADEGKLVMMHQDFVTCKIDPPEDLQNTEIPGLFFLDRSGEYFNATYEQAIEQICRMVQNSPFRKTNKVYERSVGHEMGKSETKKEGYDWKKDK